MGKLRSSAASISRADRRRVGVGIQVDEHVGRAALLAERLRVRVGGRVVADEVAVVGERPDHRQRHRIAADRLRGEGRADVEVLVLGERLVDHRLIVGEVGEQLVRALVPIQAQHLSRGRRVDQGQCALLAADLVLGEPQRRRDLDPVDRGDLVADADRDVREAVVVGDRQIADQRLVDRVVDRALDPGGEHGHERDQRQPDHQRRGGRRRAARVADRVLVREPAGDAAQPLERRADHGRQRRDQDRAQQRDPEEDGDRADADPGLAGAQGAGDPERHRRRAEQPEDRAGGGAATTFAGGRRDDAVAQPGDRGHAGGAQRRGQGRDHRDHHAEDEADDDRPRLDHGPGRGQVDAERRRTGC